MRDLNANALAEIATKKGIEPVIIIDVNWSGDNITQYADKEVDTISGKILEVANLDAVVNISNSSDTQEISITLIDIDGSIKTIIDNNDIHKRDVTVYQWFEGLALADRFVLFKGKINSPIVWNESKRTLSFDVISDLEDNEIGYSAEEGLFESMPKSVIGQAWPMCFGTTAHHKCLRMTDRITGTLADGLSFYDFGLAMRRTAIGQIKLIVSQKFWGGFPSIGICDGRCQKGRSDLITARTQTYTDQITAITRTLAAQPTLNLHPRILGGEFFPQGTPLYVQIGNVSFYGKLNDNVFTFIGEDQHPNIGDFHDENGYVGNVIYPGYTALDRARMLYDNRKYSGKTLPHKDQTKYVQYMLGHTYYGSYLNGNVVGDNAGYVYIKPGTVVNISSPEPQTYVVSIVPGTVLRVSAWAESEGQRFLQDVDPDDYRVYTEQYGDLTVTFLEINDALSKRHGFSWSDDVHVIFESDVGPNTVEILQYIIETYSDFTVDAASFTVAKAAVENYPSHFALLERKELFTVLQEIAWQARCAIWLKNGVFFIKYLPNEPTPVATITESDVATETLSLHHTPTEDLVTKMTCEWRESGLQDDPYTTILRHNIAKYGTHDQDYDFYIYNYVDAVIKSATFWLIRYSNTWKILKFEVPLTLLNVETFDAVMLDFTSDYASTSSIIAMVDSAIYNSDNNSIEMSCWCPVKAGTMEPYIFAYPAQVDGQETFPTDFEIQEGFDGGNSPGKDNVSRFGFRKLNYENRTQHVYRLHDEDPFNFADKTYSENLEEGEDRGLEDKGNPTPSDIGDGYGGPQIVRPTEAFGPNEPGAESIDPRGAPFSENTNIGTPYDLGDEIAQAARDAENERVGEGSGEGDPNDLPDPSNVPDNPCNAEVLVYWTGPITTVTRPCEGVWTVDEVNDGIMTRAGTQGRTGFANTSVAEPERFLFNTCEAAQAFYDAMQAYLLTCRFIVGQPAIGFISFSIVGCQFDCENPEEAAREDGMIGYRPTNDQGSPGLP